MQQDTHRSATAYETDYYLWLQETHHLLERRNFAAIDIEHLLEEIDDLSRREQRKLKNLLRQLWVHLLTLHYWSNEVSRSGSHWRAEIISFHQQILDELEDSPSLRRYICEIYESCYADAREIAAARAQLPLTTFPEQPWIGCENMFDRSKSLL